MYSRVRFASALNALKGGVTLSRIFTVIGKILVFLVGIYLAQILWHVCSPVETAILALLLVLSIFILNAQIRIDALEKSMKTQAQEGKEKEHVQEE